MVCLILAPELRYRFERLNTPAPLVASSALSSSAIGVYGGSTSVTAASSSPVALFANFFQNIRATQQRSEQQSAVPAAATTSGAALRVSSYSPNTIDPSSSSSPNPHSPLIINWRIPLLSEALSHAANVESLLDALSATGAPPSSLIRGGQTMDGRGASGSPRRGGSNISGGGTETLGMPLGNALGRLASSQQQYSEEHSFISPEFLHLFLYDMETQKILKSIDPSFSAEELKLGNSSVSVNTGNAPNINTPYSGPQVSSGYAHATGRFGIFVTVNVGPSLLAFYNYNNNKLHAGSGPELGGVPRGGLFPLVGSTPLSAAAHFVSCGKALTITGLRRQRVRKESTSTLPHSSSSSSVVGVGRESSPQQFGLSYWSSDSLAMCQMTGAGGGSNGTSNTFQSRGTEGSGLWYDGVSNKPALVTFRVSKFIPATAAHGNFADLRNVPAVPSVMVGLMERKTAEEIIMRGSRRSEAMDTKHDEAGDGEEGSRADSLPSPIVGDAKATTKDKDPFKLPLPIPYILQLVYSEEERDKSMHVSQRGGRTASFSHGSSATPVPKCIMMDVTSGSLLATPFVIPPTALPGGTSENASSGAQNPTVPSTPAAYAVHDEAAYYPYCPNVASGGSAADASRTATPITFQLVPPDPTAVLGPSQPPVAVLRVLSQGEVLHKYAFVATRKQLKDMVPVVQISTPNTLVDIE